MFHLKPKPEAADMGRPGDAGPGRGLLGDRHDAGHPLVAGGVDLLEEARQRRGSRVRRGCSGIHSPASRE